MKKLILLVMLISGVASAQWQKWSKVDPFKGATTTVMATGYGGDFPYNKPSIVFRTRKNDGLEVYVTGAGSLACKNGLITFSWGDPNDTVDFSLSGSQGGDAGFFKFSFVDLDDLVKRLKAGSLVHVQFETRCSNNRFKIRLNGSTAALNAIFNRAWHKQAEKIRQRQIARILEEANERKAMEIKKELLNRKLDLFGIDDYNKGRVHRAMKTWKYNEPYVYVDTISKNNTGWMEIYIKAGGTDVELETILLRYERPSN